MGGKPEVTFSVTIWLIAGNLVTTNYLLGKCWLSKAELGLMGKARESHMSSNNSYHNVGGLVGAETRSSGIELNIVKDYASYSNGIIYIRILSWAPGSKTSLIVLWLALTDCEHVKLLYSAMIFEKKKEKQERKLNSVTRNCSFYGAEALESKIGK